MPLDEKSDLIITNRQLQSTQPIDLSPRRTESPKELQLATIKLHNEVASFAKHSRAESNSLQFVSVPTKEMQIAINVNNTSRQPIKAATLKMSVKQTSRFNEGAVESTNKSVKRSPD